MELFDLLTRPIFQAELLWATFYCVQVSLSGMEASTTACFLGTLNEMLLQRHGINYKIQLK